MKHCKSGQKENERSELWPSSWCTCRQMWCRRRFESAYVAIWLPLSSWSFMSLPCCLCQKSYQNCINQGIVTKMVYWCCLIIWHNLHAFQASKIIWFNVIYYSWQNLKYILYVFSSKHIYIKCYTLNILQKKLYMYFNIFKNLVFICYFNIVLYL